MVGATTKRFLIGALYVPGAHLLLAPFRRGRATILMLHRFEQPELGVRGHPAGELRQLLAYLRRNRFPVMAVADLLRTVISGEPVPDSAVAFTIADGSEGEARVGLEVFAEFDCPATVFVTTGFLDGSLWYWWDRVEYVFDNTRLPGLPPGCGLPEYRWTDEDERSRVKADFIQHCKALPEAEKEAAIARLAAAAEVEIPRAAPARYAPMSWDTLRSYEQRGMRFGPHSMTHPILSRTPDAIAEREIAGSWQRLREEAREPAPVFCYPQGEAGDFGPRDYAILARTGLLAALTGIAGYVDRRCAGPDTRWRIPRFPYAESHINIQYVTGLEHLKDKLRNPGGRA